MSLRRFRSIISKERPVAIYLISELPESMEPTTGLKSRVTWIQRAEPKLSALPNIILKNNCTSSEELGSKTCERNCPTLQKIGKTNTPPEKAQHWVETCQGLVNLNYVSRVYLDDPICHLGRAKLWTLRFYMFNQQKEVFYAKYFDCEEKSQEDYQKIKNMLRCM